LAPAGAERATPSKPSRSTAQKRFPITFSKNVTERRVPLIDAGPCGIAPLLPVDLQDQLLDRPEGQAGGQNAQIVFGVALETGRDVGLCVELLVTHIRGEPGPRAGAKREKIEGALQIPSLLAAADGVFSLESVQLVDEIGVADVRSRVQAAQPESAPAPV